MSYANRRSWKSRGYGNRYKTASGFKIRKLVLFLLLLFAAYQLVTSLMIGSVRVESVSMEPGIISGSVVAVTPVFFGPELPLIEARLPVIRNPKRGEIVLVRPAFYQKSPWYARTLDSAVRFFTLQKKGFINRDDKWIESPVVKRIIGMPGDVVKMEGMEILIKPKNMNHFFSESEVLQMEYQTGKYPKPDNWPGNFPLSGNTGEIIIGDDEYFVAGDNRSMSSDSFLWGVVKKENITAKVLFEYAPEIKRIQ